MFNSLKNKKMIFIKATEKRKFQQKEGKLKILTFKFSSVLNFISLKTCNDDDVLTLEPVDTFDLNQLDLCLLFDHVDPSHSYSYVRSRF